MNGFYNPIVPYSGFTISTPTLPNFYWNVYSNEQRFKHMCKELHKICEYANMLGININLTHKMVEELQETFDKFKESGFDDYYKEQLQTWIETHLPELFTLFVKQVYFGLTDDGHFCAYIPDSWGDIQFDTGAVYGRSDYGRLILKFEPDPNAHGVIDNTYSNYTLNANQQTMQQLIADLESTTRRSDATYNAMFSNLDVEVNNGNF